jgi:dephospho-CoA kinase
VVREAAILFESGADRDCDLVVTVEAPEALRVERALARDTTHSLTRQDVEARMARQWTREARVARADVVIENDGRPLLPQVLQLLDAILPQRNP